MARYNVLNFEIGREYIGDIGTSVNAHQAVGRWWAHAILQGIFDAGSESPGFADAGRQSANEVENVMDLILPRIGGFALELERLSSGLELAVIRCDFYPDTVLHEAAARAEMPRKPRHLFPWKSSTTIQEDGTGVLANLGWSNPAEIIWPPELVDPDLV